VSRTRLVEQVWKVDLIGTDNLIDVHVSNLRRKVDGGDRPALIYTVRGRGFRLAVPEDRGGLSTLHGGSMWTLPRTWCGCAMRGYFASFAAAAWSSGRRRTTSAFLAI